jgi:hypothetical protein
MQAGFGSSAYPINRLAFGVRRSAFGVPDSGVRKGFIKIGQPSYRSPIKHVAIRSRLRERWQSPYRDQDINVQELHS